MDIIKRAIAISKDAKQSSWIAPTLLFIDAIFCALIIWKVPYTEIDWRAYMQQVELYIKGERNYYNIEGQTGPLVYPALHVYIYRVLYAVTSHGKDIFAAQVIFSGVYLASLAVVMGCYRLAKAPPYIFPLLILSKRMHSIFLLRLFNDCFAVLFLWLAVYAYQKKQWTLGSTLYSCGLGVKMSVLLGLPAVGFVLLQGISSERGITQAMLIVQTQGLLGYEFVKVHWRAYIGRAFQLTRQFLYKWTVNWRFIPEEIFLSKPFSYTLLTAHASLLILFATTRWTSPSKRSLIQTLKLFFSQEQNFRVTDPIAARVNPEFVLTTIMTANAIGMLCARSLHYQFFAWTAWASPFLLWRSGFGPVFVVGIWAAQEWAWNVYPSASMSSVVVVLSLAAQVAGVWWGTRVVDEPPVVMANKDAKKDE
ncbi:Lethal(2)neighbour of Tid protein [Tothia fuscella]|uniref:Dol-P-Man:Man(5)GlcNAc(2)-PP-Dol alpha-1,3-mannosyltransferase n=1 Tax=Tothia fuscella TaxID=1048955 RepID=A0A9P4TXJ4_9PEZI|nr:Lethal(2)neighbour of Tid protein [Tothia fuscella]